jgi:hypothetical protein
MFFHLNVSTQYARVDSKLLESTRYDSHAYLYISALTSRVGPVPLRPQDNRRAMETGEGGGGVGRCRLTVSTPELKAPRYHRLKLEYDEPLPNFAFNFDLRRYTGGAPPSPTGGVRSPGEPDWLLAGAYPRPLLTST